VGRPTIILADAVKGKGVSFMQNQAGWHARSMSREELTKALEELGLSDRIPVQRLLDKAKQYQVEVEHKLAEKMPKFFPRLLVARRRHHEGQDGSDTQRLWPVACRKRR
jgi:transketolase